MSAVERHKPTLVRKAASEFFVNTNCDLFLFFSFRPDAIKRKVFSPLRENVLVVEEKNAPTSSV
jgi:hypothetical protein